MIAAMILAAMADPCGMVPPVHVSDDGGRAIERTDDQRTYVFFRDGIETMALRPGFVGRVDQFGMLIPFPSAPELRKIDDDLFAQIEAAVDPPEVKVTLYDPRPEPDLRSRLSMAAPQALASREASGADGLGYFDLAPDAVRVVREEAVGMYQAAVLEAGSAQAMQRWMDENGYRYPQGMDATVDDYLSMRWCFVAIKANIGTAQGLEPRPGMRQTRGGLPDGAQFDGHVQGMAFRFEVDEPVVPMRLSVFNGGDPRNVVYVLADVPVRFARVPRETVVRQVDGQRLHRNLTEPLPVTWTNGGDEKQMREADVTRLDQARNPEAYSSKAADLFASDLLAARSGRLSLALEDEEKQLVNISEALGLRGDAVDGYIATVMDEQRGWASEAALDDLKEMTLTVIDGQLDPELLASTNLTFYRYTMPWDENVRRNDALRPSGQHLSFQRVAGLGQSWGLGDWPY